MSSLAAATKLVDFGGDYVDTSTILTSGQQTTLVKGTHRVFWVSKVAGTVTLVNSGTTDLLEVTSGAAYYWEASDINPGYAFDLETGRDSTEKVLLLDNQSGGSAYLIVKVGGSWYRSRQSRSGSGTNKPWSIADLRTNPNSGFYAFNIATLTASTTLITDLPLNNVTAAGCHHLITSGGPFTQQGIEISGNWYDITPPELSTLDPANGTETVERNTDLVAVFTKDIQAGSGSITLTNVTSGISSNIAVTDDSQIAIAGSTLTIAAVAAGGLAIPVQAPAAAAEPSSWWRTGRSPCRAP